MPTTPNAVPNHHTVGRHFKAHDGRIYWCDSYDRSRGYWMTAVDAPAENLDDEDGEWRRCVSERAVGSTFHEIRPDRPDRHWCRLGPVDSSLLVIPGADRARAPWM